MGRRVLGRERSPRAGSVGGRRQGSLRSPTCAGGYKCGGVCTLLSVELVK